MMQENLLRFVVTDDTNYRVELVIEKQAGGRYIMRITDDVTAEIELTPGLLQELRRTMGKIA